jgi:hypothetical protein
MPSATVQRALDRLTTDESIHRDQLAGMVVDSMLDATLNEVVEVDRLVEMLVAAVTPANVERLIERHVQPGRERFAAFTRETGDRPRDILAKDMIPRIEQIVRNAKLPKGKWAKDAVDPALIRQLVSPVIQETLLSFTKRLPLPGAAGAGSSAGASSRSSIGNSVSDGFGFLKNRVKAEVKSFAPGIVDAAKERIGEFNAEVERKFQGVASEFSHNAQSEIEGAFTARAKSDEGRALLDKIRLQVFHRLLDTTFHELDQDTARLPWDDIFALVPEIASHAIALPNIQQGLRNEIAAVMAMEGERTVRDLLAEAGITEHVESWLVDQTGDRIVALVGTEAFAEWLTALMAK